ncbi:MAG: hypothetical protein ABIU05_14135, partial [Nitrospirales bacterium]
MAIGHYATYRVPPDAIVIFRNIPLIALFGCVETSWGTVREVGDAKGGVQTDNTLREFGKSVVALRTVLHQDRPL